MITAKRIKQLKMILRSHPGKSPIHFKVNMNGQDAVSMVSRKIKVTVDTSLLDELEKILTLDNIKVKIRQNHIRIINKN